MSDTLVLEPNTDDVILDVSQKLHISVERAGFIEFMRDHYITWEHDYIKESPEDETS